MKENILDVLIYLFENYLFDDQEQHAEQATLTTKLNAAGFESSTIDQAFDWLDNLAQLCEQNAFELPTQCHAAIRHYSEPEQAQLSLEVRARLLLLEQCGVLNPSAREMVIDQLMALDEESIQIEQLKWVLLMIVSNYADEDIPELSEALLLGDPHTAIH